MKITFIFHSGFAVETASCLLIFDFWMDPAHVLPQLLQTSKPVYVFASHFHEDHFTREILEWKGKYHLGNCTIILSKDILKRRRAKKEEADVWMAKGNVWEDGTVKAIACGSTDSGVSWIVETEGKRIFHAGDLNNWYARFLTPDYDGGNIVSREFGEINPLREEKAYLGELKDIAKTADSFDIVFFPIDGRIGNGYTRGGRQFIARFKTGLFVPMHFTASGFESAWRMEEYTQEAQIPFWRIKKNGEELIEETI